MTPDQQTVLRLLAQHAQRDASTLAIDEALVDLGIDSLKFIMLILDIEQALCRPVFNIENIGELHNVDDLLAMALPLSVS